MYENPEVLLTTKGLAVIPVAILALQTDLLSLCQNHLEDASLFVAQAYGKANPIYKVTSTKY